MPGNSYVCCSLPAAAAYCAPALSEHTHATSLQCFLSVAETTDRISANTKAFSPPRLFAHKCCSHDTVVAMTTLQANNMGMLHAR